MQNRKDKPIKYPITLPHLVAQWRFIMRYRNHPELLEPYLAEWEAAGVPEAKLAELRAVLIGWLEGYSNRIGPASRIDRYMLTGMGAVDLVLLSVVLPQGAGDAPLFIANLFLVISIVLVASSLFVSFVKSDAGITVYGKVHRDLVALALITGTTSLVASFWHASSLIGIVLLILTVLAYVLCSMYSVLVILANPVLRQLETLVSAQPENSEPPIDESSGPASQPEPEEVSK